MELPVAEFAKVAAERVRFELEQYLPAETIARIAPSLAVLKRSSKEDRVEAHKRRTAAMKAAGYGHLNMVPVRTAHVDYLMSAWDIRTKGELVRVALAYLVKQTKDGLKAIEVERETQGE
jgi:hypothetical protein